LLQSSPLGLNPAKGFGGSAVGLLLRGRGEKGRGEKRSRGGITMGFSLPKVNFSAYVAAL